MDGSATVSASLVTSSRPLTFSAAIVASAVKKYEAHLSAAFPEVMTAALPPLTAMRSAAAAVT